GAMDIGPKSGGLLVAAVLAAAQGAEPLRVVVRAGEPCRLARGLARRGAIDDEIAERAAAIAAEFAGRARALGAQRVLIGATAALRGAANGKEIAAAIGERTGSPVRVLSGEDEARLGYRSVVHGPGLPARGHAGAVS